MSEENNKQEPELPTGDVEGTNPDGLKEVALDNEMKQWFVKYIGDKYEPEDGVVTVEMAVAVMAKEFPEFLLVIAEENWIRGYRQGVTDSEEGVRLALEEAGIEGTITVPPQKPDESSAVVDEPPEEEPSEEDDG